MKKFVYFLMFLTFLPPQAEAIVIRHDVDADAYLASEANYPGVFNLITTPRGYRDCPVTLITPGWGVTAAHCADGPRLRQGIEGGEGFSVKAGGEDNAVVEVVVHPTWHGGPDAGSFDLALVRLKTPVSGVTPYAIYEYGDEVGKTVIMVGWGGTGNGADGMSGEDAKFRVAENTVVGAFPQVLMWTFSIPESGEARPLEGISGPGDSGGPAFIETEEGLALAGISSGQDPGGKRPGMYGVTEYYARISTAAEWIHSVVDK